MASLTIRKLDDAVRDALRLRAARSGRSVEDEVRVILRAASEHHPAAEDTIWRSISPQAATSSPALRNLATGLLSVTLIVGGGIAAYKAMDLIRRLKERNVH